MTAAPGEHDPADTRSTDRASLAFAAVNSMLKLEESLISARIHIVGNRRSAQRDRLAQHFLHSTVKFG